MKVKDIHQGVVYNPLQKMTAKWVDTDHNLVVLAPTSSGKTIVAEQFLCKAIMEGKRGLYLSPYKSITQEKLTGWSDLDISKAAITSDHLKHPRSITERLVLMTTEALDSRTRGAHSWLEDVGVVIVDEADLLAAAGRGDAIEVGLTRFARQNKCRIVMLSATIPNAGELGAWLTILNGRPTKVIKTDWRPVRQEHYLVIAPNKEWSFDNKVYEVVERLRFDNPDRQILVFVHSIYKGKELSRRLGCPFHYSKLSADQRHNIEDGYKAKRISVLVATSTLAYGVNLPADIGVICGAHRGITDVDPRQIKQMAGRIGRYGLNEMGEIHYVFKQYHAQEMWQACHAVPDVKSVLSKRLYFHVCSFVAREGMTVSDMEHFLSKSLASLQGDVGLHGAIETLCRYGILHRDGDTLTKTSLARASALMYVDPIDLYHVKKNLADKPKSPTLIAMALADIPSLAYDTYVPSADDLVQMPYGFQTLLATALKQWLNGEEVREGFASVLYTYIADCERLISALRIAGMSRSYLDALSIMLENGVPEDLTALVSIPHIGRKRALVLREFGIKTPDDIVKNERKGVNILGKQVYQAAKLHIMHSKGGSKLVAVF
ncbi:MAG TPA: DEAD/DEAH box helicase [Anaerolineales bacterium]|nr:DEAD/DEAH box helicase [Anaerolineales bacterium]